MVKDLSRPRLHPCTTDVIASSLSTLVLKRRASSGAPSMSMFTPFHIPKLFIFISLMKDCI